MYSNWSQASQFVKPFCEDGHDFIRKAAGLVVSASRAGEFARVPVPFSRKREGRRPSPVQMRIPPTISHFVMNLPASAIEFLHNFKGLYYGLEDRFTPHTSTELPIVHVYCFAIKSDDDQATHQICDAIEKQIGIRLNLGSMKVEGEVSIPNVRDVAPAKRMLCASFRLPRSVAFGSPA